MFAPEPTSPAYSPESPAYALGAFSGGAVASASVCNVFRTMQGTDPYAADAACIMCADAFQAEDVKLGCDACFGRCKDKQDFDGYMHPGCLGKWSKKTCPMCNTRLYDV